MSDLETYRREARAWLEAVEPTFGKGARAGLSEPEDLVFGRRYQRAKFDAGYAGINWPVDCGGQGLSPLHKMIFEQEELRFDLPGGYFGVSLGIAVPMIMHHAPDRAWARERVIEALKGETIWCQLFSEPSGGSDLGGVRTKAESRGHDGWTINGQKLWTTFAQYADYGVIVARSDPTVPKHKGLTFFWLDMRAPGVSVRPIKLADADDHVNEVFFDDVALSDTQRIGAVGQGFAMAIATLMIERYAAADPAGFGPPFDNFIELVKECEVHGRPAIEDGRIRSVIARTHAMRAGLESINTRAMLMMAAGMEPGPEGSLNKLVSVRSRQKLSELAIDLMGSVGLVWDRRGLAKEDWVASWFGAPTLRIAGGADEMLLNTIAEKILGLPQDYRPDKGIPFNQIPV
jgi:alkylation response protein AidB-like acyl-CoA dehydrogenase